MKTGECEKKNAKKKLSRRESNPGPKRVVSEMLDKLVCYRYTTEDVRTLAFAVVGGIDGRWSTNAPYKPENPASGRMKSPGTLVPQSPPLTCALWRSFNTQRHFLLDTNITNNAQSLLV
jgi:hypothetical protein